MGLVCLIVISNEIQGNFDMNNTKEDMVEAFEERGYDIDACTCNSCSNKDNCKYAFDLYNTEGDCLASK